MTFSYSRYSRLTRRVIKPKKIKLHSAFEGEHSTVPHSPKKALRNTTKKIIFNYNAIYFGISCRWCEFTFFCCSNRLQRFQMQKKKLFNMWWNFLHRFKLQSFYECIRNCEKKLGIFKIWVLISFLISTYLRRFLRISPRLLLLGLHFF